MRADGVCMVMGGCTHLRGEGPVSQSEHGMLVLDDCEVRWLTKSGLAVHRRYHCASKPMCAVFTTFPRYSADLSVVILVNARFLQINLVNGGTLDMPLPVAIKSIHAGPEGLLLESVEPVLYEAPYLSGAHDHGLNEDRKRGRTVQFSETGVASMSRTTGLNMSNMSNMSKSSIKSPHAGASPSMMATGKPNSSLHRDGKMRGTGRVEASANGSRNPYWSVLFSLASPYALLAPVHTQWGELSSGPSEPTTSSHKAPRKILALHEDMLLMLEGGTGPDDASAMLRLCKFSTAAVYKRAGGTAHGFNSTMQSSFGEDSSISGDLGHDHHHHSNHQVDSPGSQMDVGGFVNPTGMLHSISADVGMNMVGTLQQQQQLQQHILQPQGMAAGKPRSRPNSRNKNTYGGASPTASALDRQSPSLLFNPPRIPGGGGDRSRSSSPMGLETNRNAAIVQTLMGSSGSSLPIDKAGTMGGGIGSPTGVGGGQMGTSTLFGAGMLGTNNLYGKTYGSAGSQRSEGSAASAYSSTALSRKQTRMEQGGKVDMMGISGYATLTEEWGKEVALPHGYLAAPSFSLEEWDRTALPTDVEAMEEEDDNDDGGGGAGPFGRDIGLLLEEVDAEFALNLRGELVVFVRRGSQVACLELQAGRLTTPLSAPHRIATTVRLPLESRTMQARTSSSEQRSGDVTVHVVLQSPFTPALLLDSGLSEEFQIPLVLPPEELQQLEQECTEMGQGALRFSLGQGGSAQLVELTSRRLLGIPPVLPMSPSSGVIASCICAIRNAADVPVHMVAEAITILVAASRCAAGAKTADAGFAVAILLFGAFGLPLTLVEALHDCASEVPQSLHDMVAVFQGHCSEDVNTSYGDRASSISIAAVLFDCVHTVLEDLSFQPLPGTDGQLAGLSTVLDVVVMTCPDDSPSRQQYMDYYAKFLSRQQEMLVYSFAENCAGVRARCSNNAHLVPSAVCLIAAVLQECTASTESQLEIEAMDDCLHAAPLSFTTPVTRTAGCCESLWLNLSFLECMWHRFRTDRRTESIISVHDGANVWGEAGDARVKMKAYSPVPSGEPKYDAAALICLALLQSMQESGLPMTELCPRMLSLHRSLREIADRALKVCMTSSTSIFVACSTGAGVAQVRPLPLHVLFPPELLKAYGRIDVVASVISQHMALTSQSESESIDGELEAGTHGPLPASIVQMFTGLVLPKPILQALGRPNPSGCVKSSAGGVASDKAAKLGLGDNSDGLAHVEDAAVARFPEDLRVREVCRLLRSSRPLYVRLERAPETNDQQHKHKIQVKLLSLCRRSLAAPVGRGALTMGSIDPLLAERLPVPPLALSGRLAPTQSIVELDISSAPAELTLWPEFHNGVAAGLRISPGSSKITRNWILFNRPTSQEGTGQVSSIAENGHAGMLLGLGLNGMLKNLSDTDLCDYLTQGHEPTIMAILIGMSATHIGKADTRLSRTLCLFLPALLPPRHWDMHVSATVQAAALTGLGLLHCGTAHRLMIEFLLAEMIRRPNTIADAPVAELGGNCREALSLCGGWALGMVLLGRGTAGDDSGILDLHIEDRLQHYVNGGRRPPESVLFPLTHQRAGDTNSKSSRVMEGDVLNTNVTAPGAMIALALMYMKSNDQSVAARIATPQSGFELDRLRPDFFVFRAVAQCLVLWDSVQPDYGWIHTMVPQIILKTLASTHDKKGATGKKDGEGDGDIPSDGVIAMVTDENETAVVSTNATDIRTASAHVTPGPGRRSTAVPTPSRAKLPTGEASNSSGNTSTGLDAEAATQAYLSITSGFCWGVGLTHAGTQSLKARDTLLHHLRVLQTLRDQAGSVASNMAKPKREHTELDTVSVAAGGPRLASLVTWVKAKAARPLLELCISLVALSLAAVMAGSGDVASLRIIRELRWRADDSNYGGHMALSTALGWLFLGGGNASLRRDQVSVAALVAAMCPRFPSRTVDNQYHIQALRHLYAVAVEWRNLRVVDVESGESLSVPVDIHMTSGEVHHATAPCLLSELSAIDSIELAATLTPEVGEDGKQCRLVAAPLLLTSGRGGIRDEGARDISQKPANMTAMEEHSTTRRAVPPLIVTSVRHTVDAVGSSSSSRRNAGDAATVEVEMSWRRGQQHAIGRLLRSATAVAEPTGLGLLYVGDGDLRFQAEEAAMVRHSTALLGFGSTSLDVQDLREFSETGRLTGDEHRHRRLMWFIQALLLPPRSQWPECGLSTVIESLPESPHHPLAEILLGALVEA